MIVIDNFCKFVFVSYSIFSPARSLSASNSAENRWNREKLKLRSCDVSESAVSTPNLLHRRFLGLFHRKKFSLFSISALRFQSLSKDFWSCHHSKTFWSSRLLKILWTLLIWKILSSCCHLSISCQTKNKMWIRFLHLLSLYFLTKLNQ